MPGTRRLSSLPSDASTCPTISPPATATRSLATIGASRDHTALMIPTSSCPSPPRPEKASRTIRSTSARSSSVVGRTEASTGIGRFSNVRPPSINAPLRTQAFWGIRPDPMETSWAPLSVGISRPVARSPYRGEAAGPRPCAVRLRRGRGLGPDAQSRLRRICGPRRCSDLVGARPCPLCAASRGAGPTLMGQMVRCRHVSISGSVLCRAGRIGDDAGGMRLGSSASISPGTSGPVDFNPRFRKTGPPTGNLCRN